MPATTADTVTLADVQRAAAQAVKAADAAKVALDWRDHQALRAYESGGCTYASLAEALGVTTDRVRQVLREQRKRPRTTT